jgi:hypothetical protein
MVYSGRLGTREQIKYWADTNPIVKNWRYDMPNSIYLVSNERASTISDSVHNELGSGRFLITEISNNRNGYLPQKTWRFLNRDRNEE